MMQFAWLIMFARLTIIAMLVFMALRLITRAEITPPPRSMHSSLSG